MAFGILKDDKSRTRVGKAVLSRIFDVISHLSNDDYPGAFEKVANVMF